MRVARAAGLVAAGIIVLTNRDAVVDLIVTLAGVYLIFKGVESVLRLIYRPEVGGGVARGHADAPGAAAGDHPPARGGGHRRAP